eukprot:TRINITY_DN335_c0_g1_i1.p1 TRINITY_DN335_c0_g1~~TRINITY_DN335_c0_g1_i1.p1  ORF type:complete len:464 (+),score=131.50 TRINITY_DN335_c0_g1_i1:89-1480(+)
MAGAPASAFPDFEYSIPQLEAVVAQARKSEPCFGTPGFSLEGFFKERQVQSCPASGIGAPPGLESVVSCAIAEEEDPLDGIFNTASDFGSWGQEHAAQQALPLFLPHLLQAQGETGPKASPAPTAQSRSTSAGSSKATSSSPGPCRVSDPSTNVSSGKFLTAEQFAALASSQEELRRENSQLLARIEQLELAAHRKAQDFWQQEAEATHEVQTRFYNIGADDEEAADDIFNTSSEYGSWGQDKGEILPPQPLPASVPSLQQLPAAARTGPPPPPLQAPVLPPPLAAPALPPRVAFEEPAVQRLVQSGASFSTGPPPPPAAAPRGLPAVVPLLQTSPPPPAAAPSCVAVGPPMMPPPQGPPAVPPEVAQVGSARCPSVGSAGHFHGSCKPCAFFWTKGCESGVQCGYCHLCPAGEKKRRQREKFEAGRIRSYLWRKAAAEAHAAQVAAQMAAVPPGQYPAALLR